MSAVHVPEAGKKGGSCFFFFWGTACDSDLSCDDNHVCQDNAEPGKLCGDYASGLDCMATLWCLACEDDVVTYCRYIFPLCHTSSKGKSVSQRRVTETNTENDVYISNVIELNYYMYGKCELLV